jgi:3-dehydroquinate dehydratase / shikimate dehydrogenase
MTMDTQLCITVTAPTMADLRARRDRHPAGTLLELRLDTVDRPDVDAALAGRRGPVVVTCRARWEGGQFAGSEEERMRLLAAALDGGAEFVDVEFAAVTPTFLTETRRHRVLLSMHDFTGVPADLEARVAAMRQSGAGVVKVAVLTPTLTDVIRVRDLSRAAEGGDGAAAFIAMGEAGLVSRVLPERFGSCWTYAADSTSAAPGQLTADAMTRVFGAPRAGGRTALYGVLGRPVSHSVSPAMHNAAFRALGVDAVYLPLPAVSFDDFLRFADAFDVQGVSVTAPYKRDAFHLARTVNDEEQRAGAINTLRRGTEGWEGRNTDIQGFLAPLFAHGPLDGRRATVLGAGGAARGVALGLRDAGARVTITARRPDQAAAVADALGVESAPWPPAPGTWDLLVNATPVGTAPDTDRSPVAADRLDGGLVYDLVYNPPRTRLLADAAGRGCHTLGGLDMLVAQAHAQHTWWTGRHPPADVMRDAAIARLEEMQTL